MIQDILRTLVSFKTTEDNPEEIKKGFEYIASLFDSTKFEVQNIEHNGKYSQLISFRGRDAMKPKILLNGHFDVVPTEDESQYQLRIEGNKGFGRGTVDMKGMVAVLLEVMQELGAQKSPPDIVLLITGDEEIAGDNGVGYFVRELGIKPAFVLCGDGGNEKWEICTKEKGVLWLELVAQGKTAHGAYPWLGENALEKLIDAIQSVRKFFGKMEPEAWKSTVNLGVVETSNKTPNKVPGEAKAILDIRFTEELAKTPDELLEKMQKLVPDVKIRALEKGSLLFVEETNPLLQDFKRVAEKVIGSEVSFAFEHGATDARYFGEVGIPCIVFGAVGGNFHAAGEWVDLESLETNKKILLRFLENFSS